LNQRNVKDIDMNRRGVASSECARYDGWYGWEQFWTVVGEC